MHLNYKQLKKMSTRNYYNFSSKLITLLLIGLMIACSSDKKKVDDASKEFDASKSKVERKVKKALNDIPPPADVPYIIHNTGADFNPGIVNDLKKYEGYMVSPKKAAFNLGVYATDIGYLSSYGKTQEALNSLDVCLKLTEAIGAQDAVDMKVLARFEANLSNTDSLGAIINEVISNSSNYLTDNDRDNVAALIVSGSYIEAIYVASQIIETYPKDILPDDQRMTILTPLIRLMVDQRESLKNIVELLESVDDKDEWIVATTHSLEELYENYKKFNPEEKIKESKGNEVLNDEVFTGLSDQIKKIRSNIVY